MNILLIGSGGREHALAYALYNSNSTGKLYCAPGNPGILNFCDFADIDPLNFSDVVTFCKTNVIDLVVVGPEQPLSFGIADYLLGNRIKVFGPTKNAAMLESSKGYAKDFMFKYNIPTAEFKKFSSLEKEKAVSYIENYTKYPVVLKADGLAAGKGVIIANNKEEALDSLELFFNGKFGDAGNTVVIEEFIEGEEASVLAITDGKNFITLASSQDHKRIFDGDNGPNTGGMGAYSPAPIVTDAVLEKVNKRILKPSIDGIAKEGAPFIGCLYAGLMINNGEPKVVEFNVRFGDPETQAVLMSFRGDFAGLLMSAAIGELDESCVDVICDNYSCCVVMVSDGYPESYEKGQIITGIREAEKTGAIIFHAGTKLTDGNIVVNGGRVLGVTGVGNSLNEAVKNAYNAVEKIHFEKSYYRKDIAKKAL
jgi:phosphoribosylamine---glycine ligase